MPTSTINQSFAECNAYLYNSGCTVQCISVRWIPNPGSSYSCTPATLHSALVDGPRSDMDNPQVYIRHKDVRPSSHQKNHFFSPKKILKKKKFAEKKSYPLSFQYKEDAIWPELSSPAHFRIQGGVVRAWRRTNERRRKSSCVILD